MTRRHPLRRRVAGLLLIGLGLAASACAFLGGGGAERERSPGDPFVRADEAPARPERLVWVSIPGLRTEDVAELPFVRAMADHGVLAERVVGVVPPSAYPAHATLVTGHRPAGHGIPADHLLGDRGTRPERYWHVSHLRAPTLWQVAAERGLAVAALDWPTTLGADVAHLLPDVVPTRRGDDWVELVADAASPWLAERARGAPPTVAFPGPSRDAFLVDAACDLLAERPPALLLLRLSQSEPFLVRDGPDAVRAHGGAVAELARLVGCLSRQALLRTTTLVLTGDRPMVPIHSAVRPNRALADAGLVTRDGEGELVEAWSAWVRSNGSSAFVYARDTGSAVDARAALREAAEASGAFRLLRAEDLLGAGADPEAWFGLEARPGWAFEDGVAGPLVEPADVRGANAGIGDPAGAGPAFVLWGPGVRAGTRLPELSQLDVAPTLSRLLGIELPGAEGRPVVGLLALPAAAAGAR